MVMDTSMKSETWLNFEEIVIHSVSQFLHHMGLLVYVPYVKTKNKKRERKICLLVSVMLVFTCM